MPPDIGPWRFVTGTDLTHSPHGEPALVERSFLISAEFVGLPIDGKGEAEHAQLAVFAALVLCEAPQLVAHVCDHGRETPARSVPVTKRQGPMSGGNVRFRGTADVCEQLSAARVVIDLNQT